MKKNRLFLVIGFFLIVLSIYFYQPYRKNIAEKSFNQELVRLGVSRDDLTEVKGIRRFKFPSYQYFFKVKGSRYEYIFTYYFKYKYSNLDYITDKTEIVNTDKIMFE